jgi:hypothetical protein
MDLDVVAKAHGNLPITWRGFRDDHGPPTATSSASPTRCRRRTGSCVRLQRRCVLKLLVHWPEIPAVHPFLLANGAWENFAWVSGAPPDTNGDGIREPTPYPQYVAVRQLSRSETPEWLRHFAADRGPRHAEGDCHLQRHRRSVPYATLSTDGYAFGHVSLRWRYEIHDVGGSYTLTVEERLPRRELAVCHGWERDRGGLQLLFRAAYEGSTSSTPRGQCPRRNLWFVLTVLHRVRDIHRIKYAAVKLHRRIA